MKGTMTFFKGLGLGMATGAAATFVCKTVLEDKHNISKGSAKVVKAVGEIVDGIQTMFR